MILAPSYASSCTARHRGPMAEGGAYSRPGMRPTCMPRSLVRAAGTLSRLRMNRRNPPPGRAPNVARIVNLASGLAAVATGRGGKCKAGQFGRSPHEVKGDSRP